MDEAVTPMTFEGDQFPLAQGSWSGNEITYCQMQPKTSQASLPQSSYPAK